jgi:hypothetical protein
VTQTSADDFQRVLLERIRVAASVHLGPQMAHDVDVSVEDLAGYLGQGLVLKISSFLVAMERDRSAEEVPFSTDAWFGQMADFSTVVEVRMPRSWWQEHKPAWWARLWRRKYRAEPVPVSGRTFVEGTTLCHGTVTVQRKVSDAFPDNQRLLPPDFGRVMTIEQFSQAG